MQPLDAAALTKMTFVCREDLIKVRIIRMYSWLHNEEQRARNSIILGPAMMTFRRAPGILDHPA